MLVQALREGCLVAIFAAVYAPGLRELLHNIPPTMGEFGLSFAVGAVASVPVELAKAIRRH